MCAYREGWNPTQDPNEWMKQTSKGFCLVRATGKETPYVRCYTGNGGNPEDFLANALEDCFALGDMFLEKLEASEPVRHEVLVGDIMLFTKLLDAGYPLRCTCDHIWRYVPDERFGRTTCPNCGRGIEHGVACDILEYKNSRKD